MYKSDDIIQRQIQGGLTVVKRILETWKQPQSASTVSHSYPDKFALAEQMTNLALSAHLDILELLGLTPAHLAAALLWHRRDSRAVSLRISSDLSCQFVRQQTKVTEGPERVSSTKVNGLSVASSSSKVKTTVTEHVWRLTLSYRLLLLPGTDDSAAITLDQFSGDVETITVTEQAPFPSRLFNQDAHADLSFLLASLDASGARACLAIDRASPSCRTPRRNAQVADALVFSSRMADFYLSLLRYFRTDFLAKHRLSAAASPADFPADRSSACFVPVLPVMDASEHAPGPLLTAEDCAKLLAEHRRALLDEIAATCGVLPAPGDANCALLSSLQGKIVLLAAHGARLGREYGEAVDAVEAMLYAQLVRAVGKEVSAGDFAEYMRHHRQRLFREEFQPLPFSYAVRRPLRFPEGVVAIEELDDAQRSRPVATVVRRVARGHPMRCQISESVALSFAGERFVHSWMSQQFQSAPEPSYRITARARAFSSFILVLARVASATAIEPVAAVLLGSKDELHIPLLFERLPTPQQFRDAISSLSPEMQRFAKAYRAMQLESTLFCLCVIEVKPQLERLLRLPQDALTKHIKLTQDLLDLFIEHQIPSDLLSYDGDEHAPLADKIQRVAHHAQAVAAIIDAQRAADLAKAEEERRMRELERIRAEEEARLRVERENSERRNLRSRRQMDLEINSVSKPQVKSKGGFLSSVFTSFGARKESAAPMMLMEEGCVDADMPSFSGHVQSAPKPAEPPCPEECAAEPPEIAEPAPSGGESTSSEPAKKQPVESSGQGPSAAGEPGEAVEDYSKIPARLDQYFDQFDDDSAVRAAIIKPGLVWTMHTNNILAEVTTKTLDVDAQKAERNRAFDLLDALSRSGTLPIESASLHIVLAASHAFEHSIIETIIQDNVNPIAKVERSILIASAAIHQLPVLSIVHPDHAERISNDLPLICSSNFSS